MNPRVKAGLPFAAFAVAAIAAGGVVAAAIAYHPTQQLVWMVAYLVLVVGVMQGVFGAGQAWLAPQPPATRTVWGQWAVFNLGNTGVIAGTLCSHFGWVVAGTVLFAAAIAWLAWSVRGSRRRRWALAYGVLLGLVFASSLVGVVVSAVANSA